MFPVVRRATYGLLLVAVALGAGDATRRLFEERTAAIPRFVEHYQVFTKSGSTPLFHGTKNPGAVHPIDVDADGTPDIDVHVTIAADASDVLEAYGDIGAGTENVVAPIIRITRSREDIAKTKTDGTAQDAKDLAVVLTFTIEDLSPTDPEPDTYLRFGYATGPGGTIPPAFNAVVGGLANFFDPVVAVVDTRNERNNTDLTSQLVPTYDGPLSLIVGTQQNPVTASGDREARDASRTDVTLRYRPMPGAVQVRYDQGDAASSETDDGTVLTTATDTAIYQHDAPGQVDLSAYVDTTESADSFGGDLTGRDNPAGYPLARDPHSFEPTLLYPTPADDNVRRIDARVDRLPSRVEVELDSTVETTDDAAATVLRTAGAIDVQVPPTARTANGRLPDARVELTTDNRPEPDETERTYSHTVADLEQIPSELSGRWSDPALDCTDRTQARCLPEVGFEAKGDVTRPDGTTEPAYVGAVELRSTNVPPKELAVEEFRPARRQYASLRSRMIDRATQELTALRIERIRSLSFKATFDGIEAVADVGDGALPLEVDVSTDERHVPGDNDRFGNRLDVSATVAPLPRDVHLRIDGLDTPGAPIDVHYATCPPDPETGERPCVPVPVTIDGWAEIRGPETLDRGTTTTPEKAKEKACGAPYTKCLEELHARHLPGKAHVRFADSPTAVEVDIETVTDGQADPALRPDVFAKVKQRSTLAEAAIVADVELTGIPRHVSVLARKKPAGGVERVEVHPCRRSNGACVPGTSGEIRGVTATVRNFLTRPEGLPETYGLGPEYAAVRVRPAADADPAESHPAGKDLFEVSARVTDVREVQYVSKDGLTGVRVYAGAGTQPFYVMADMQRIKLGDIGVGDLWAESTVQNLPTRLDICFRQPGGALDNTGEPVAQRCETTAPFGRDPAGHPVGGTKAPLSMAYDGNSDFTVQADVRLTRLNGAGQADDDHITASLKLNDVPADVTAHVAMPDDTNRALRTQVDTGTVVAAASTGPLDRAGGETVDGVVVKAGDRVLVKNQPDPKDNGVYVVRDSAWERSGDANTAQELIGLVVTAIGGGRKGDSFRLTSTDDPFVVGTSPLTVTSITRPQMNLDFEATMADGDLACGDPRTPARGDQSVCISGRIENLPNGVTLSYEPDKTEKNLRVASDGARVLDLKDLRLTAIRGVADSEDPAKTVPSVIDATGDLIGLPRAVEGTLILPGDVQISASPPTPEAAVQLVDVEVRNYIAPDPLLDLKPLDRTGVPVAEQKFVLLQRGDHFKATGYLKQLVGAGYRAARDVDGRLLDTTNVTVDFGKGQTIRAYADLQYVTPPDPETGDEDLTHIVADVTLDQVPSGIELCFRGEKTAPTEPVQKSFCDTEPSDDEGALRIARARNAVGDLSGLDVYSFVRVSKDVTDVLSAKADILNVPHVVEGTFTTDGAVDFVGKDQDGNLDGIDKVKFELANSDLQDVGYDESLVPWGQRVNGRPAFASKPPEAQYLQASLDDHSFRVRGEIGAVEGAGQPGSNLQRLQLSSTPCAKPEGVRADYPYLPDDLQSEHLCLRADFEQVNLPPGESSPDPLGIDLTVEKEALKLQVREARLTDVPAMVQVNLAEAAVLDAEGKLREPCPRANPGDPAPDCMPPLLRIDTSSETMLEGRLLLGEGLRLARLALTQPRGEMPNLLAAPDQWTEWDGAPGIRVKVGAYKDAADAPVDLAVIGNVRLRIPASVQVDQFQLWSGMDGPEDVAKPGETIGGAMDVRLRYTARNLDGTRATGLGQIAGMVQLKLYDESLLDDDEVDEPFDERQILLSGADHPSDEDTPDNLKKGLKLPGELGIAMFVRPNQNTFDDPPNTRQKRVFVQLDGRASETLDLRVRMYDRPPLMALNAELRNLPTIASSDTGTSYPSFRLRAEIIDKATRDEDDTFWTGAKKVLLFYAGVRVDVKEIAADIDFKPTDEQVHRVDTVVNLDLPVIGVETRGYRTVEGAPGSNANKAPISGRVNVRLDPFDMFLHAGVPILGSFDMVMLSEFKSEINIDRATKFQARNNLLHLTAYHEGPGHDSYLYAGLRPKLLTGLAFSLAFAITGNPVLYGFTYAWPPFLPPDTLMTYYPCPIWNLPGADIGVLSVDPHADAVAFPMDDPRFIEYGTLEEVFDLVENVAWPFFCLASTQIDLIDEHHPLPPTPTSEEQQAEWDKHPVPSLGTLTAPPPPPVSEPAPPKVLEVADGATLEICGSHGYESGTVGTGATLRVATAAGEHCRAEDVGTLNLTFLEEFTVKGTLDATPATGTVDVTANQITVAAGATVKGSAHRVSLLAADRLEVSGTVLADNVATNAGAGVGSSNSGAGHGGTGGRGSARRGQGTPGGGTPYGNHDQEQFDPGDDSRIPTEPGARGGGGDLGNAGNGGGQVYLAGDVVRIAGSVTANGGSGGTTTAGACAVPDDPNTEPNEATPNTGLRGGGGGSGGGVVVVATVADVTGGRLEARGGAGGNGRAGGGGGGAGGIVEVLAPVLRGTAPAVTGGAAGASLCENDYQHGSAGEKGDVWQRRMPASRAKPLDEFWNRGVGEDGNGLAVPIRGAAQVTASSDRFDVVLCGSRRPPNAGAPKQGNDPDDPDFVPADDQFGIDMPDTNSVAVPCGRHTDADDSYVDQYGAVTIGGSESADDATVVAKPELLGHDGRNGFVGFYTVALKPGKLGDASKKANSCVDRDDFKLDGNGLAYDVADCVVEPVPQTPDQVAGIDNDKPTFTFEGPAETNEGKATFVVKDVKDDHDSVFYDRVANQSGVRVIECSTDGEEWAFCPTGTFELDLPDVDTDGNSVVRARAIDLAGNVTEKQLTVKRNVSLPASTATAVDFDGNPVSPDGKNGWYSLAPTWRIEGTSEDATRAEYWFNDGTHRTCQLPCHVKTGIPLAGKHAFHWQAIDTAGNREPVRTEFANVDQDDPAVAIVAGPQLPDGGNSWYVTEPWIVVNAVDRPAGSGLVRGPGDVQAGAGVYVGINGATPTLQTGPVQLHEGVNEVCWYAEDVAGNRTDQECRTFLVDAADPSVGLDAPAPPDSGWYGTAPQVSVYGVDSASGVDENVGNRADLCRPVRPARRAATPSGVCVSIDGRPFVSYGHGLDFRSDPSFRAVLEAVKVTLPQGGHEIRSFAVDVSGRRSALRVDTVLVDTTAPVTVARTVPPQDPTIAPGAVDVRRTRPRLVLSSVDHEFGSGVAEVRYSLDGGTTWAVYTGPVPLPDDDYDIRYYAVDRAGRTETTRSFLTLVDGTAPTATAGKPEYTTPLVGGKWLPVYDVNGNITNPVTLPFTYSESGSGVAQVYVLIYGTLIPSKGDVPLRTLTAAPGQTSVTWDAKRDDRDHGVPILKKVTPGNYYYRVVVIDRAGNATHSSESVEIPVA